MPFTTINPNATTATAFQAQGREVFVRRLQADGTIDSGAAWLHLGALQDWSESTDVQKAKFESNLSGKTKTYAEVTKSVSTSYEFKTGSVGDKDVFEAYWGGALIAGVTADVSGASVSTGTSLPVEVLIVRKTDGPGGSVRHIPSASLSGSGEDVVDDVFTVYGFNLTVQTADNYVAPATLVNFSGAKSPEGNIYRAATNAALEEIKDELTGA